LLAIELRVSPAELLELPPAMLATLVDELARRAA